MGIPELRKIVHDQVDIADEHILQAVHALLDEYNKSKSNYALSDEQIEILKERKSRYEIDEHAGLSWDEVQGRLKR
jgi:hypothetical protein